ncbi:MAG: head GIN domain-containing protein [Coriobacteriia bacterium]
MRIRWLRAFVAVACALCSVSLLGGCVRGSGTIVTEDRQVGDVSRVELRGSGRLEITQGSTTSLTIEADDNLMRYLTTENQNGTLVISVRSGGIPFLPVDPSRQIIYRLTVPSLSSVTLSGSGDIVAPEFEADSLEVNISGSGTLSLTDFAADRFVYKLSGSGRATLSGKVGDEDITISGSGRLEAGDLEASNVSIDINGSGRAIVWATDQLNVNISGSGRVEYYGSPQVSQQVSGSGQINQLGEK